MGWFETREEKYLGICYASFSYPCGIKWCKKWGIRYPCGFRWCTGSFPYPCIKTRTVEVWCERYAWVKCTGYLVYETCEACDELGKRYKWSHGDFDVGLETSQGVTLCFKPEDIEDAGSCSPGDMEIEKPVDPQDNRPLALSGVAGSTVVGVLAASASSSRPGYALLDPVGQLPTWIVVGYVISGIFMVLLSMGLYRGTRRVSKLRAGPMLIALSGLVLVSKGLYSLAPYRLGGYDIVSTFLFYAVAGSVAPLSFWRLFKDSRTWGILSRISLVLGLASGVTLAGSYLALSPFREAASLLSVATTVAWTLAASIRLLYVPVLRVVRNHHPQPA